MKKKRNLSYQRCTGIQRAYLSVKLTFLILLMGLIDIQASDAIQDMKVSIKVTEQSVEKVLDILENTCGVKFFYQTEQVDLNRRVTVDVNQLALDEVLEMIFSSEGITYKMRNKNMVVLLPSDNVAFQQNMTITGRVSDENGESLPGVNITQKSDPSRGVITDIDGNYSIEVSGPGSVLVFSYIGFNTKEVVVGNATSYNVLLVSTITGLDEVVVTALGIKREVKAIGYAVAEVGGETISAGKDLNVMNSLSGRMAGVDISSTTAGPSGSTRMLIRGNSQLSGSNQPLYVIDGMPMDNTQLGSADKWGGYDFGDGLSSINPDDIESITVLKGPSAAALYGSRASNGVVLITTKTAEKKGIGVEITSNINAVSLLSGFDDYQTTYGQGRNGELPITEALSRNSALSAWGPKLDPNLTTPIYNGEIKPYGAKENNILSFFRTGTTIQNSASLTAAGDKANIRFSMSNMQNKDIVPNSDMSRSSFMLKGGAQLNELLSFEARANYTLENVNNRPALSDSPNNVGISLIGIPANFDQKWLGQNFKDKYGHYNDWNGNNIYRINPYWSINEMGNESYKERFMGHIQLNFDFTPWLSLQVKGGTDSYSFRMTDYSPISTPTNQSGSMEEISAKVAESNGETMLHFNKRFADVFNLSAFVGGNIMYYKSERISNVGKTQIIPDMQYIGNYTQKEVTYGFAEKQVNSVYGAINMGYNDFAYLDFTLRNDWSSTLSDDFNSYMYPSLSGSFVFSELITDRSFLSFGKLRASWAEVGGDTNPYQLSLNYHLLPTAFNDMPLGQIQSKSIPKKDLKPTRTYSWEIGTDIRFINNRFGLDLAYYNQTTEDQILSLPISKTTGYETAIVNAGEIKNSGIEAMLSANLISTSNFNWDMNITFAKNINTVVKLHPEVNEYVLAEARWAGAFVKAREGEAYGVIVGKKSKRDPNGNVIHGNGGLPEFGEEAEVLGNGVYDWTGGLSSVLAYKGVSLSFLFDVKWGADVYSMSNMFAHINGTSKNTLEGRQGWYDSEEQRKAAGKTPQEWVATNGYIGKGVINTGTEDAPVYEENTVMVNPQSYWTAFYDGSPEPFINDASFIKLRETTITYTLNKRIVNKTPFSAASLSVYGRNLWIIYSSLDNIDPESNYNNGNGQGLEYGSLPSRRTFGVSLNLKF